MTSMRQQRRSLLIRPAPNGRRPPESQAERVTRLDKRTLIGRDISSMRDQLVAHVGGQPSATQAALIELVLQLRVRLAAMDAEFAEAGAMSEHASRTYLAWSNSMARALSSLGMKGAPAAKAPTLADIIGTIK
jgi:hypothetical protein